MKRFWKSAAIIEDAGWYCIRLDGRPMRLPGGPELRLRQLALAEAIAAEWQAAGGAFSADDVPLTRLAGTAQERIVPDPRPTAVALAAYAESDLLCYRAEGPEPLVVRQHHAWQPWLDWAAGAYGARLVVTRGVMPVRQDAAAVAALRAAMLGLDPFVLAGLGVLVPSFGSCVLGLAVAAGRLAAEEALRLSMVDERGWRGMWRRRRGSWRWRWREGGGAGGVGAGAGRGVSRLAGAGGGSTRGERVGAEFGGWAG
jgi:chaperone required for assembly of F1-ATPase